MDSALRPREIQSRIRAGQSLEEVARASGEHAERIERFAAPVLAEREHVAGLALASSVRRRGELGGHRSLRAAVAERLMAHGVDPDSVAWDAWRNKDRRWTVHGAWTQDDEERSARFQFDLVSRFSVADDAESRWLIAEDEESVERDELALVHAVSGDLTPAGSLLDAGQVDPDEEPTISLADVPLRFGSGPQDAGWHPRSAATPEEIREELEAEIDAYGLVPDGRSELDVLYDMLSGIAEDSINIYAGLTDPIVSERVEDIAPPPSELEPEPIAPAAVRAARSPHEGAPQEGAPIEPRELDSRTPTGSDVDDSAPTLRAVPDQGRPEPAAANAPTKMPAPASPSVPAVDASTVPSVDHHLRPLTEPTEPHLQDEADDADSSTELPADVAQDQPATGSAQDPPATSAAQHPPATSSAQDQLGPTGDQPGSGIGQAPLVDNEPTVQVAPGAAKRRGARKKRASVPSWDEIMFGGPKLD